MSIKPFNISTSARANLFGEHYAGLVYTANVVFHPDDVEYGILRCDDIFIGIDAPEPSTLQPDDRIYTGDLHVRDVIINDK